MKPPKPTRQDAAHRGLLYQLFFSHALVAVLVALLTNFLNSLLSHTSSLLLIVQIAPQAGFLGLLFTLNITLSFKRIERTLTRLSRGQNPEPETVGPTSRWVWPLRGVLDNLQGPAERLHRQNQEREGSGEERGQWLEQVNQVAAQEERNRLARELHDSIKQQIFSITVSAAAAQARWESDPGGARTALDDVRRNAREAQVEMNALLQQLRPAPLENTSLAIALRDQCEALQYRTGAEVSTHLGDLPPDDRLPTGTQEAIFRIVQEAFGNIARHARASHVRLDLQARRHAGADWLVLEVGDDGQGFVHDKGSKTATTGMGLRNMTERAAGLGGTLQIGSRPGHGTHLNLWIPLRDLAAPPLVLPADLRPRLARLQTRLIVSTALAVVTTLASVIAYLVATQGGGLNLFSSDPLNLLWLALFLAPLSFNWQYARRRTLELEAATPEQSATSAKMPTRKCCWRRCAARPGVRQC